MKRILVILGICITLLSAPLITALPNELLEKSKLIKPAIPLLEKETVALEDPPEWANGNFTGVWGLNILGLPLEPSGWITGYYQNIGLGNLAAVFGEFNETNASGVLKGIMLWIFFLGAVGNPETGNGTYVTGIGVANDTHYYVRLNAIVGPSFYIHVEYTKFE